MSRQLLLDLNGNYYGELKKFINSTNGEPRIGWYPSAGRDFRALIYLSKVYSKRNPPTEPEPPSPDLFLFTDYYPWDASSFLYKGTIYSDKKTKVVVEHMEELPSLSLPVDNNLVDFPKGGSITNEVVFLKINVISSTHGFFSYPVLYAFAVNETFYCKKLVPNKAKISHLIHIRYGGGCGGGGKASGVWLVHVLKNLGCELFITDNHYHWQSGDEYALTLCPSISTSNESQLTPIRTLGGKYWSGHGNVTWNLVR
jgi:hypothetical protein